VLRDRGFIDPDPTKAPKHAHRSFSAERANQCWQIDATKWRLADRSLVEIINIIDDCTRLAVTSVAVSSCTTATTWNAICDGAQRWGWPARVLTDNGSAFRGNPKGGTGGIHPNLATLGITIGHSRPYHPQTCGKVERFHQTLKRFLISRDPPNNLAELQTQLDNFTNLYNHHRPHRSIGRRTPAAVFADTPKDGPHHHALGTPTRTRTGKIINGTLGLGGHVSIAVGACYNGEQATAITTGIHTHVFIAGHLIRALTIDPTRTYQPLNNRPGRPTQSDVPRHP
jgi:Integrase core domain